MSSSYAELFGRVLAEVRDLVDFYVGEDKPNSAAEFASKIHAAKEDFEADIADLPDPRQANFFNEAVARAVLSRAAYDAVNGSDDQAVLLKLTLAMLYGPGMLRPSGWISLGVFLDDAVAMLLDYRTHIVAWIAGGGQEVDEATRRNFRVYENVGCFVAGLWAALQAATSWHLAEDLRTAGRFGRRLISDILMVDEGSTILYPMREILFSVPFAWIVDSKGFFVHELFRTGDGDLREVRLWCERLGDFFVTWQCRDRDYKERVSKEIRRFDVLLSLNSE